MWSAFFSEVISFSLNEYQTMLNFVIAILTLFDYR